MSTELETGTLLLNKYRIEAKLGQGGFGSVYRATDILLGRTVAIKMISQSQTSLDGRYGAGSFETFVERFQREAMVSAFFTQNRNIIVVYGLERDQDSYYLVLEYLEGGSLAQLLREANGPLPIARVGALALDICNALTAIHQHPADIVHRDLKPANVLLRKTGEAVVADFGIAQLGRESQRTTFSTSPHPGSPAYRSPEQAANSSYLTPASDLYSLGLMLYEMTTGRLFARVRQLPPSRLNPQIPGWLDQIIIRLLQDNPQQRYQTAGEVADSLRAGLNSGPVSSSSYGKWGPPPPPPVGIQSLPAAGATESMPRLTTPPPGYISQPRQLPTNWHVSSYPARPDQPQTGSKGAIRWIVGLAALALLVLIGLVVVLVLNTSNPTAAPQNAFVATATVRPATLLATSTATEEAAIPTLAEPPTTPTLAPTATPDINRQNRDATATARVVGPTQTAAAALTPPVASAQVQALIAGFEQRKHQVYGPAKGKLTQSQSGNAVEDSAGVNLKDFEVEAQFYNAVSPLIGVNQDWDYGFLFRESDAKFYHLLVSFQREWQLTLYEVIDGRTKSTKIASGRIGNLDISEKGSNRLKLYASGDTAYLYVNDVFTASIAIGANTTSGQVSVIAGANTNTINGKLSPTIVSYENFAVYSLG